jgi:hypothetical protein
MSQVCGQIYFPFDVPLSLGRYESFPEMLTIAKEEKVLAVGFCQSFNLYRLDIQSKRKLEPASVSSVFLSVS